MATTVSPTKINFMSEDTFNKLSSLDSQQLYAVEASSLITSVMNNDKGYYAKVGDLLIQWGDINVDTANTVTITFPVSFSDLNYVIVKNPGYDSSSGIGARSTSFYNRTVSSAQTYISNKDYDQQWLAIGY